MISEESLKDYYEIKDMLVIAKQKLEEGARPTTGNDALKIKIKSIENDMKLINDKYAKLKRDLGL